MSTRGKQSGEGPVTVDLSKAKTMEPLPTPGPYLVILTKMAPGTSGSGGRKVDIETQVVEPETPGIKGRKFFESINLDNEYTLGRLQSILRVLGVSDDDLKSSEFALKGEDFIGKSFTIFAGMRSDPNFGDRNTIARVGDEAAYRAAVEAASAAAPV